MLVRMGNPRPHSDLAQPDGSVERVYANVGAPVVFSCRIPLRDKSGYTVTMGDDVPAIMRHLLQHTGMVTHLGEGHEAILAIVRAWEGHCEDPATWVDCVPELGVDDETHGPTSEDPALVEDFERQIAEYYGCPRGAPVDVEATHHTTESAPPGVDSGRFATAQEA